MVGCVSLPRYTTWLTTVVQGCEGDYMAVMSIKQYAESIGISYEGARKNIKRYAKELEGHIFKDEKTKTTRLDDVAQEILNKKRNSSPIVVSDREISEENDALKKEIDRLRAKLEEKQDKIEMLLEQNQILIEDKNTLMIEQKNTDALTRSIEEKDAELSRYKKTIFGLYRKE